jgi:hypothetical protein
MGQAKLQDKIYLVPFRRLVIFWCKTYETICSRCDIFFKGAGKAVVLSILQILKWNSVKSQFHVHLKFCWKFFFIQILTKIKKIIKNNEIIITIYLFLSIIFFDFFLKFLFFKFLKWLVFHLIITIFFY